MFLKDASWRYKTTNVWALLPSSGDTLKAAMPKRRLFYTAIKGPQTHF